ncbi:MAG: glycosyltransferase [Acidimicrobiia bacterium]|nr:glycosyltransferase [Acidimicrobiia bacterium]
MVTLESLLMLLAILMLVKGFVGMLEGVRYLDYVRKHLAIRPEPWMPAVSVIVPCKGLDFEIEENVEAVFRQVYPFFEVLIVTATENDPAVGPLKCLAAKFPGHRIRFLAAGVSSERGEKVHNLIWAVAQADAASEVLVFTDSDSRPHLSWLQELVAPLRDRHIGVSTGYRWYYPTHGNLPSVIRSIWNGSIATLLGSHDHNFAWGGSMAVRKRTFDETRVLDYWSQSISDDYSMTQAMKAAQLRVHYEPRCLLGSYGRCCWSELLEWTTRQVILTKVYSRKLWWLALVSQWTFCLVWWWALAGVAVLSLAPMWHKVTFAIWSGGAPKYALVSGLLYFFGAVRGWYRVSTIQHLRPERREWIQNFRWAYVWLFPLGSTLMAYNLARSMFASSVEWRGVRYEFGVAGELRVIRNE